MATAPTIPQVDPRTIVRKSEKLWSDVVVAADPDGALDPYEKAYEFGNRPPFVERGRYNNGQGNG